MNMEFLGVDLAHLVESNKHLLTPEAILKEFPLDFLTKPITPLILAPDIEVGKCETSWIEDITGMVAEVLRQPWTQLAGIGLAVTGITVCSWKFSRYWDEAYDMTTNESSMAEETKKYDVDSTKVRTISTLTSSTVPSVRSLYCDRQFNSSGFLDISMFKSLDREGFESRIGKVLWRVRDIVRDLGDLDSQRQTLQEEIRLHQETCSKLQKLGNLERSKRQAAEDKMKMIESENLQLKHLNQIIAKKARLIDKLEFIIQEKNALESSVASPSWVLQGASAQNESHLQADEKDVDCRLPLHLDTIHKDTVGVEQKLKQASSDSTCSAKGDQSPSVIVLNEEEDPHERFQRSSLRWQSPSPENREFICIQSITSTTSSLTNISRRKNKTWKRRSNSHHGTSKRDSISEKRSVNVKSKTNVERVDAYFSQMSPNVLRAGGEDENPMGVLQEESFATEVNTNDNIFGINGYNFEALVSPPKHYLRQSESRNQSLTCSCNAIDYSQVSINDSVEAHCSELLNSGVGGIIQCHKAEKNEVTTNFNSDGNRETIVYQNEKLLSNADEEINIFHERLPLRLGKEPNIFYKSMPSKLDKGKHFIHKNLPMNSDGETHVDYDNMHSIPEVEDDDFQPTLHSQWNSENVNIHVNEGLYSTGEDLEIQEEALNLVTRCIPKTGIEISTESSILAPPLDTSTPLAVKVPEYDAEEKLEMLCYRERPVHDRVSFFPGITSVFKKKKLFSSKNQEQQTNGQIHAVRFINKIANKNACGEEEGDLNQAKKGDDTSWVVVTNNDSK